MSTFFSLSAVAWIQTKLYFGNTKAEIKINVYLIESYIDFCLFHKTKNLIPQDLVFKQIQRLIKKWQKPSFIQWKPFMQVVIFSLNKCDYSWFQFSQNWSFFATRKKTNLCSHYEHKFYARNPQKAEAFLRGKPLPGNTPKARKLKC